METTGFSIKNAIRVILWLILLQFGFVIIASALRASGLLTFPSPFLSGVLVLLVYGLITAVVYFYVKKSTIYPWVALGIRPVSIGRILAYTGGGIFLMLTGSFLYGLLLRLLGVTSPNLEKDLIAMFGSSNIGLIVTFIAVVIIAPFAEELFFRGFLYPSFRNSWGVIWAIVATSLLFALAHFQALILLPIYFFIGAVLAFTREKTNSIIPTILLHALNNFIFFLILLRLVR